VPDDTDDLLDEIARREAETPQDAAKIRARLEGLAQAALHGTQGTLMATFRAYGARTRRDRALILEHYYGDPPHTTLRQAATEDGIRFALRPEHPKPGCLACAHDLERDGYQLLIRPMPESLADAADEEAR
jgi:hypothetical protein